MVPAQDSDSYTREPRKDEAVSIKSNPPADEIPPSGEAGGKPGEDQAASSSESAKPSRNEKSLHDLKLGEMIGVYRIEKLAGRGGMASVYRAFDTSKQRVVALKVLKKRLSSSSKALARFDREFLALESLNHPSIVKVLDKGEESGTNYFVMEYVDGASLSRLIKHAKLSFNTKAQILLQVAGALEYAHQRGIIHRDVKPDNVLIDRTGRAKIADFGIAQMTSAGLSLSSITVASSYMGTADYMAPEQRVDAKSVDRRADIFSFGVMLYETFTGKLPLGNFPLPSQVNPELSKRMDGIILKALRQDPNERYQSIMELATELRQEIRPSALDRLKARALLILQTESWKRLLNLRVAGSIALLVLLIGAFLWFFSALNEPEPQGTAAGKATTAAPAAVSSDAQLSRMVLIPSGEFIMGSDSNFANERPQRKVFVNAFYIGAYEVTNAEYKKFIDATGRPAPYVNAFWAEPFNWRNNTYPPGKADHPVVLVSWLDASAYAKWAGMRLPTEAEWEKAARGTDGRMWPWGNTWDANKCNVRESFINMTQPVNAFSAGTSPYGCYSMAGNVMEWTNDWYSENYYAHAPNKNPSGPLSPAGPSQNKVVRGGAWDSNLNLYARATYRQHLPVTAKKANVGFRCANDAETKRQE